ncbi:hypothetical protein [Streptomyces sp. NPDC005336]|uniref:hypothetical protein n=1 Tax=unclassified Streptomyces TaxID=2593676 RepID=UPI0033B8AA75
MRASTRTGSWPTAVCALVLAAAVTGCGGSGAGPGPGPESPSPQPSSPVRLCVDLISYWAEQDLIGGRWAGLDWEQKGLSNQQYEIYDAIVRAARAERKRHGTEAARELIARRSEARCAAENGATRSSENWRPPA